MKQAILISVITFIFSFCLKAQNPSLTAYFQSEVRHESYKVFFVSNTAKKQYGSTLIKKFKVDKKAVLIPIVIPIDSNQQFKNGNFFPLYISKKSKLGLWYRDTLCEVAFDVSKKYLVLYRDRKMKSRYAITYYWSDELPTNY